MSSVKVERTVFSALLLAVGAVLATAGSAWGAFGISAFDGAVSDSVGGAFTQAGGHPDTASTTFTMNRTVDAHGLPDIDGSDLREARVDLPAGFVGNPTAMPACPSVAKVPSGNQAAGQFDANEFCSLNSIVGVAELVTQNGTQGTGVSRYVTPVFSVEPPPGVAAQFAFSFQDLPTTLDAVVRSDGDYGVTVVSRNVLQLKAVLGTKITLWGTPADHSHDSRRCMAFYDVGGSGSAFFPEEGPLPECKSDFFTRTFQPWLAPNPADVPPKAFLANPTACTADGVGLETRLHVVGWDPSRPTDDAAFISHLPPGWPAPPAEWGPPQGPTGCDKVPFDPSFAIESETRKPDAPTGLSVDLSFPSDGVANPVGISTGHLKRATVRLPAGWSVSPSSADGLAGCSDAESHVGTLLGAACPPASKIGTVEATTPLLDEKLTGGVFVGTQESDDPLSGRMFRMFIALNNEERGIHVKLPGQIRVDPGTGQIETTFDNNPQVPVESISLRLKGGPRAPLATPLDCGTKQATAELESWSGAVVTRASSVSIDCPGAGPLAPVFTAGVTGNLAGRHTSFVLRADRPDATQVVDGLSVRMPPGLLAKLNGVPRCAEAAASAGTCPEISRVGTATVGAGPGSHPFFLQGGVYLTGPYKKGPFGLAVAVQAKAGPFDLGMVVVRQQLMVDPIDAHVDVVSDPLPTVVKGVPVRLRSLHVAVDRKNFVLNPTSCQSKTILATFKAPNGSVFTADSPFGAIGCAGLPLKPRLKIGLTGKGQTTDGKHPGVRAQVVQRKGDANLKRVQVRLPLSLALDPDNAQALCEFKDGTKVDPVCPKGSIVGRAKAVTPLLDQPLSGPVYFVKNVRKDAKTGREIRTLPMLVIPLRGENGIRLNLKGASSVSSSDQLVNTFAAIPDAPVTRFDLSIEGGKNGILVTNGNLCRRKQVANVQIDGQNSKASDRNTTLTTSCKKAKKHTTKKR